jgi:hypothetical protein
VRFLLAIPLLLALLGGGCATPQQKAAKAQEKLESKEKADNSRLVEQRRMMEIENGRAGSQRGAEVMILDKYKSFDPSRSAVGGRTYTLSTAQTKTFSGSKNAAVSPYRTGDFYGSKSAWSGERKFNTKQAATGSYATRQAQVKTASTNTAWDAGKTAAVRDLPDGQREYLGPESKKLRNAVDPASMADWRSGGGETVVNTGKSVEKYSTMKQLTVDDIRDLLNKNK